MDLQKKTTPLCLISKHVEHILCSEAVLDLHMSTNQHLVEAAVARMGNIRKGTLQNVKYSVT